MRTPTVHLPLIAALLAVGLLFSDAPVIGADATRDDSSTDLGQRSAADQDEGRGNTSQTRGDATDVEQRLRARERRASFTKLINVDFEGGSVADYFDHLLDLADFNVLFLGDGDPTTREHAPVRLEQVSLGDAVAMPQSLAEGVHVTARRNIVRVRVQGQGDEAAPVPQPDRFDLEFDGGTLAALAEAIREASPRANIIIMQTARDFELPAFKLRDVTAVEVFRVLDSYVPDPSRRLSINVVEPEVDGRLDRDVRPQPLIRVEVQHHSRRARGEQSQPSVQQMVWSTAELELESAVSTDVLHGAIDAALELAGSEAEVRYHPGAKLLIARGTDDDLLLIDSVLKQVKTSAVWIGQREGVGQREGE